MHNCSLITCVICLPRPKQRYKIPGINAFSVMMMNRKHEHNNTVMQIMNVYQNKTGYRASDLGARLMPVDMQETKYLDLKNL